MFAERRRWWIHRKQRVKREQRLEWKRRSKWIQRRHRRAGEHRCPSQRIQLRIGPAGKYSSMERVASRVAASCAEAYED
jgi:hypothetical protein